MVWATKKLRHYFKSYKVQAISKIDLLKYLFKALSFTEKLARRLVILKKIDIEYITKKVVKGSIVAKSLAQNVIEGDDPWDMKFLDENLRVIEIQKWNMYFDEAVNARGAALGVVLIMPKGELLPMAKRLDFKVTNNMGEYEACLFGLEVAAVVGGRQLMVYRDSMLVIQ
eukprot:XP_015578337.1 uncharacterized protein LOC107261718 [Ricinus communis]